MPQSRGAPVGSESRRIIFLAFSRVALLDLVGPWEVFSFANKLAVAESPPYDLELVSAEGSATIQSFGGISLASHCSAESCRGAI
ncbi:MAG: AraC family transcriptional regulator, partial [Acidobacteriota bacterium]